MRRSRFATPREVSVARDCGDLQIPPLPVRRERVGVRALFGKWKDSRPPNTPHPNPLPAYRARGQESRSLQISETPHKVLAPPEDHSRRLVRAGRVLLILGASLLIPAFWNDALIDVLGRPVLALLSGGVILLSLYSSLRSWLENPVLRFLGKYSYGLYILHFLFHPQLDRLFPLATLGIALHFICCVAVSCTLAWCSWHLLEKQCLKFKRWFPMPDRQNETSQKANPLPPSHLDDFSSFVLR